MDSDQASGRWCQAFVRAAPFDDHKHVMALTTAGLWMGDRTYRHIPYLTKTGLVCLLEIVFHLQVQVRSAQLLYRDNPNCRHY